MSNSLAATLQQAAAALKQDRFADALAWVQPWADAPDAASATLQIAAIALTKLEQWADAERYLRRALTQNPGDAGAWVNLANVQEAIERPVDAIASLTRALQLDPDRASAHFNLGKLLKYQRNWAEANAHLTRAIDLAPNRWESYGLRAEILVRTGCYEEAWHVLDMLRERDPRQAKTYLDLLTVLKKWQEMPLAQSFDESNKDTLGLFTFLNSPLSLAEFQRVSETFIASELPPPRPLAPALRARYTPHLLPRPHKLRIGYFSADFYTHATMCLMAGMFEVHDKSRFETIGICLAHRTDQNSPMRMRARKALDRFEEAGNLDDDRLVDFARRLDLHIAVDLKGFTQGNRMGVFSHRAAPIQMHYIGYPGTLGMPGAIDYQVADRVLVPIESRPFYSEKIIELPDSYQVNDRQRTIAPAVPDRAELGLPENAFVFCCFNNNYKIIREVFDLWMRLLQETPDSVLWLLADNDAVVRNLKQAAKDAGIAPERLIFAPRAKLPQHLARHARADLFLDTWPYNAHTTASDALWAGLPVLTCTGETFASRVSASLLTACHLPELITRTPQEYLARAKELAGDPNQLKAIRQKLQTTKLQAPLFDTERFTRHIEKAYDLAWARFAQGLPPDHITVPPIDGG